VIARAVRVTAVDAHAHVMRRDAPLLAERHSVPARDVDVPDYLAVLDAIMRITPARLFWYRNRRGAVMMTRRARPSCPRSARGELPCCACIA
jgi:hypothetical protein